MGGVFGSVGSVLLVGVVVTGCQSKGEGKERDAKGATSAAPASTDAPVVIELGPNGQSKVRGKELAGDAATCGSMKACCAASSDTNLFCGLAQATDGATCASVLAETQKYLSERKLAKPAGCP